MKTYTDEALKRVLARMLPKTGETRIVFTVDSGLCWNGTCVMETELLHLVWLVEEKMNEPTGLAYMRRLIPDEGISVNFQLTNLGGWHMTHATWQQRTIALAKTLGLEIE